MQGPRDPELPDGYDFDYINSDVLIHRAKVMDGRIAIPKTALPTRCWFCRSRT